MSTFIFDNEGKTFDRYTVVIVGEVFTMSHNPNTPNGFNQYAGDMDYLGFSTVDDYLTHLEVTGHNQLERDEISGDLNVAIHNREVECLITGQL
jgi:hypothetical protein